MANGVEFAGANRRYGPPAGVSEEQCKTLHVFTNGACLVSCWEFTDEEIAEIVRTRRAFLSVWSGGTLFPVFVGSESVTRGVVADFGTVWKTERAAELTLMGYPAQRPLDQSELEAVAATLDPPPHRAPPSEERVREICSWFALPESAVLVVLEVVRTRQDLAR